MTERIIRRTPPESNGDPSTREEKYFIFIRSLTPPREDKNCARYACLQLERGTVPWQKPWNSTTRIPKNLLSGKEFIGGSIFIARIYCERLMHSTDTIFQNISCSPYRHIRFRSKQSGLPHPSST
ncbi:MAG TPA: DUF1738 domain-containing protein [Nitrospiria bacterium]|nr:DUF1738 domain-containing protein [Candidatus Manganitrophaceae bacterium]HIL34436.1 DUF1738 domain-containing protein [Candidatus Manganitrophaceae bacterium]